MPGVIGFIAGTHVKIQRPTEHEGCMAYDQDDKWPHDISVLDLTKNEDLSQILEK